MVLFFFIFKTPRCFFITTLFFRTCTSDHSHRALLFRPLTLLVHLCFLYMNARGLLDTLPTPEQSLWFPRIMRWRRQRGRRQREARLRCSKLRDMHPRRATLEGTVEAPAAAAAPGAAER